MFQTNTDGYISLVNKSRFFALFLQPLMRQKFKFWKYSLFVVLQIVVIRNLYAVHETQGDTLSVAVPLSVGFNYQYGFTMNHNAAMAALNTKHFSTYELSLQRQTVGKSYWEYKCAYPAFGVTFMYSELANPQYLGRMFGLYPYLDVSLFSWKRDKKIIFTVGLGLAYGTKPYDRFDNYKNISYGSHLNVLARFGLKGNVRIFPKTDINGGVNFTHVSNGTTKEPNFGLNTPTVFIGLSYQINDASGERIVYKEETPSKYPYRLQIDTYGGYKNVSFMSGSPVYFVGELNVNLLKRYRFARSWGAGFALSMDYAKMQILKDKGEFSGKAISYMIPSVKAIHQFHINKLYIGTELCYMIYSKENQKTNVYANLTTGYYINEWLTAGLSLRAGFFFADYIGFGLGFKIWEIK